MSPWVATTRPDLAATITLQPVPQKRQGAFDHLNLVLSDLVTMLAARAGKLTPATVAATLVLDADEVLDLRTEQLEHGVDPDVDR